MLPDHFGQNIKGRKNLKILHSGKFLMLEKNKLRQFWGKFESGLIISGR
jgi:hypothetical protein